MNICIPISAPAGLDSLVVPQFSTASHWFLFDLVSRIGSIVDLESDDQPLEVDVVLCQGINRRSLRQLHAHGVDVFGTTASSVQEALAGYERGERLEPLIGCGGDRGDRHHHGQHQHDGCGCHGSGQGHGSGSCGDHHEGHGCCGGQHADN